MDRGAWRATVHMVAKNRIQLKRLSMHILCVWSFLSTLDASEKVIIIPVVMSVYSQVDDQAVTMKKQIIGDVRMW